MVPPKIPSQAYYQDKVFFNELWTRQVDRLFIATLVDHYYAGNWIVGLRNRPTILEAIEQVNHQLGSKFDTNVGVEKARRLKYRYNVFNMLIRSEGVTYNPMSQRVYAPEETWARLCEEEQLVLAYKKEGELSFEELKLLFEAEPPTDVQTPADVPVQNDVIQISSDTEGGNEVTPVVVDLIGDDDSHMSSLHSSDYSSLNTANSFWNELAWMNQATNSEQSWSTKDDVSLLSGNDVQPNLDDMKMKGKKQVASSRHKGCSKATSSSASWSPFKK